MKDIGTKIRLYRKKLGWSIQRLATLAEIDRGYLSKIETGRSTGRWETHQKIAGALGVSIETLTFRKGNVVDAPLGWRRIPILDYVQAGRWTGVDFAHVDDEMRETMMTDLEHPPSTFSMRIRGDSMSPRFSEGDLVVIDPTLQPMPGDFVVATAEDGEATFKQFRSAGRNERGQDVFELHPINPTYAIMRSDREPITIVGVMVERHEFFRRKP